MFVLLIMFICICLLFILVSLAWFLERHKNKEMLENLYFKLKAMEQQEKQREKDNYRIKEKAFFRGAWCAFKIAADYVEQEYFNY